MRAAVLCAIGALGLSACTVGPDFVPPPVATPDSFGPEPRNVRSRTTEAEPDPEWWRCFRDGELASLAERLAAQNLDLKTAAERVAQAGAERFIVASQGLPHVEGQSIDQWQRVSQNGLARRLLRSKGRRADDVLVPAAGTSTPPGRSISSARCAAPSRRRRRPRSRRSRIGAAIAIMALAELAQSYIALRGAQTAARDRRAQPAHRRRRHQARRKPLRQWRGDDARSRPGAQSEGEHRGDRCRRCARARRSSSMRSACCWGSSPALSTMNCGLQDRPRRLRASSASACRRHCCSAARTSARRWRACTRRSRRSARRRRSSIRTSTSSATSTCRA